MPIIATIGVALAVVLGGSAIAETSEPGDALYGVKTHVNESVRGGLTFGTEADARWNATLTEKRVKEAQTLAASGKLTAEMRADVQSDITARIEAAEENIAELRQAGREEAAAEVEAELASTLRAYGDAFAQLDVSATAEESADMRAEVDRFTTFLYAQADTVSADTNVNAEGEMNAEDDENDAFLELDADAEVEGNDSDASGEATSSINITL